MTDGGLPQPSKVWLRAFYGFNPEDAGYLGFTHEADRETMFTRMRDGDLVLIYGAVDELTRTDLQRQALGFLEIKLERCADRDRASQSSIDWKLNHGFENRWTHGIAVRRAWRIFLPKNCALKGASSTPVTRRPCALPFTNSVARTHTRFSAHQGKPLE